jgi:hypothetical protein
MKNFTKDNIFTSNSMILNSKKIKKFKKLKEYDINNIIILINKFLYMIKLNLIR